MANHPLREAARGRDCQVRSDHCNHNPETVVLAHFNGYGLALKYPDLIATWACSGCHDYLDSRTHGDESAILRRYFHLLGIIRTILTLIDEGWIEIKKPMTPKISKYLPRKY